MKITEEFSEVKNALPKPLYVLQDLAGIQNYYVNQSKKHPLNIYIDSTKTIAESIIETISELNQAKEAKKIKLLELDWQSELLKAHRRLLDALFIHFEDCNLIIESFFDDIKSKECNKFKKQFKDSIKIYYNHIAIPVNHIKHRNSQLRAFCFHWKDDAIIGFFLQSPNATGALGPDLDLHKDGVSALSFNRELPYY